MPDTYSITRTLSEDATGSLYRAVRRRDGLAVLIMSRVMGPDATLGVDRVRNEYELLRRLDSPWVLKPIGMDHQAMRARLILEGFDGEPLSARRRRPIDVGEFLQVALPLVTAVCDLHRHDVVHKDLNPANVLVDPGTGAVKLVGFGIAVRVGPVPAVPAGGAQIVEGSPAYMSPEQTGYMNRGVDHRSDLYSLGVVCYEMLTGQLPFEAADPMEWAHCHVARLPRPPAQVVRTIPAGLDAIMSRLLAKEAQERYQSARGLLADLEHCRDEWAANRAIPAFPLGARDASDRFLVSPRLYGREPEAQALRDAFARVCGTGRAEVALVSGYSGIGKSALVHELRRQVVAARGYFIAGKYDQYQRDVPYAIFVAAIRNLVKQILTESDADIERWKATLVAALGANSAVLTDLVPRLSLILGEQAPVPRLLPAAAENRLHLMVGRFFTAVARPEHPLVLFLDDLQWLDPASLKLLSYLLTDTERRAMLLVGAYRDNEVASAHPLATAMEQVRRGGVEVLDLVLSPLTANHLTRMVADTLQRPPAEVAPLAAVVQDKTAGNPFFAIHFLTTLYQRGLLTRDPEVGSWQWDLATIDRQGLADNVVELVLAKLKGLSATTGTALALAACVGTTIDPATLAMLSGLAVDRIDAELAGAIEEGLFCQVAGGYAFPHDRVREAAYELLPAADRPAEHLRIGRMLLERIPAGDLFEIVGHLNQGVELVTSGAEREQLVHLNLDAGRRAKSATAFASACTYLATGITLLGTDAWSAPYELAFDLHVELAEAEYLVGGFEQAEQLLAAALDRARGRMDRVRVYRLRQRLRQLSGRFDAAAADAFLAMRLFDVFLPDDDSAWAAAEAELDLVFANLAGRRIAELTDLPATDDPEATTLIGLLAEAAPLIYAHRPRLWPLITAKGVNVCISRGQTGESPFVYSCFAMVLVGVRADIPSALQFSEMALELAGRLPDAAVWRGKVLLHHAALISIWRRPFAANLPMLDEAFHACLDAGDLTHAGYLTYNAIWLHFETGDPLNRVVALAGRYCDFARLYHNDVVLHVDRMLEQFALCLQGRTRSATDFGDDGFDEADCLDALERGGFELGIAYYWIMKQVAAFLGGRLDEALDATIRAERMVLHVASMANEATHHFFRVLTFTALGDREFLSRVGPSLEMLRLWAESCPENFAHRYDLVSAELAAVDGRDLEAMHRYDQAIHSAEENGFGHWAALAAELAARFYHARGFVRIAAAYRKQARAGYARWGVAGKVRQLDEEYPEPVTAPVLAPAAVFSAPIEQLDLLSVVKASQAISRELLLPRLQETLMRLVLEHAGARRGSLLLAGGEGLAVHAWAEIEGQRTLVELLPAVRPQAAALPMSVINYVARSGESVVLADAAATEPYSTDEYVRAGRTRSAIGLPLIRQGRLLAFSTSRTTSSRGPSTVARGRCWSCWQGRPPSRSKRPGSTPTCSRRTPSGAGPRTRSARSTGNWSSASASAPRNWRRPTRTWRRSPTRCRTTCGRRCGTSPASWRRCGIAAAPRRTSKTGAIWTSSRRRPPGWAA